MRDPNTGTRPAAAYPPLYDPAFEHDACGVGFVADLAGRPDHAILTRALTAVANLTHRGAVAADARTGDGAGVLTQIPRRLLAEEIGRLELPSAPEPDLAVGMVFLSADPARGEPYRAWLEEGIARAGLRLLGWRTVPVDPSSIGAQARRTQPRIEQVLVARPAGLGDDEYERQLLLARRHAERRAEVAGVADCYVASLSSRTIVYKGLLEASQLRAFYRDLTDPRYATALAIFHQRYSTNTFPNWFLAQPFRLLAHNGEINTLQGNRTWMQAREPDLAATCWGERIAELLPVVWPAGSDSASLDNALELLARSGRDVLHSLMMLVPEAWERVPDLAERRAFGAYHACLTEPWDGPAALAFSDGTLVAAALDRNGLRPARYTVTAGGLVVMASEVGVLDLEDEVVVERGRLGPGQILAVDTAGHRLLRDDEARAEVVAHRPYARWLASNLATGEPMAPWPPSDASPANALPDSPVHLQLAFGYTAEDVRMVIDAMGCEGKEPTYSMGDDTPLAVLSRKPRLLAHYFKQRFAQVTNPPIDPLRETLVMSLDAFLGRRGSLLEETPEHARLLHLERPLLTPAQLDAIWSRPEPWLRSATIATVFDAAAGPMGLAPALDEICAEAERAVRDGAAILILSDRTISADRAAVPSLLAVSAVHHHLIRSGLRLRADLVVETGGDWDVHQFALLIGYGASAFCPYLALSLAAGLAGNRGNEPPTAAEAVRRYVKAVDDGVLKICSKMGISTLAGYRGAQIFEAVGIGRAVVDRYFPGTPSRVGGVDLRPLATDVLWRHAQAFGDVRPSRLPDFGFYRFRKEGEDHGFSPTVVRLIHQATRSGQYEDYLRYRITVESREPAALRDLMAVRDRTPVPLDEVEPVESIRQRFVTAAMSLGALSPEAHRTLAIAMNRIGGRSNTGEGGEDPEWYRPEPNGDSAASKIKQVASARFGVTPEYLARAEELEIKIAQGSKPGEGGQLPAHKVTEFIARLRHTIPGVPLISPPPHHDIYSIEDLAQLIGDLKEANPRARIGVKLVSESGVGTIAAGVAKAYADYIHIGGHDGGTGASPLSSIKGAGCPWEIGLAETQQVLVLNGLRGRVRLRVDGGLKSGQDVVVAAMLGADEFGFGTAAIVALGCDMARQCHLNTCPAGIATQREDLRAKYAGTPERAIHFLNHVAQEVREILAAIGFRRLEEIVGRVDLLTQVALDPERHPKGATLDLSALLADPDPTGERPRRCVQPRNSRPPRSAESISEEILELAAPAVERGEPVRAALAIRNCHRTVGARLAGEIVRRHGPAGLPAGTIHLTFRGAAGQSFGAFLTRGITLELAGEANDYVGKGMGGGEIVVRAPGEDGARSVEQGVENSACAADRSGRSCRAAQRRADVLAGNTILYGATGGRLFLAGRCGERFAVRNSGAVAVVEGTGDHACEYMTGGTVVVLGETGRNFGAGMTAGVAYVFDERGALPSRLNQGTVRLARITDPADAAGLALLVREHLAKTGSPRAAALLDHWEAVLPLFWKVVPQPQIDIPAERPAAARAGESSAPSRAASGRAGA
ncbi:MAG: glutamate synthase large subunit [Chloroflexi bacterium]|nr:glutamate synthase large subunit [Chloroflexota bacterium]